jgi:hypothetical protein
MARWWQTIFHNAKSHVFPVTLKPRLMRNFARRGFELMEPPESYPRDWASKEVQKAGLCLGGGGWQFEVWEPFQLPGLRLEFRAREVEMLLEHCEHLSPRFDVKRPFYKLHGDRHCVILLPQHFEALKQQMRERLPQMRAIAAAEEAEIDKRLAEIAKSPFVYVKKRPKNRRHIGDA